MLRRETCTCCGELLEATNRDPHGRGRKRLYCSKRCRQNHPGHVRRREACPVARPTDGQRKLYSVRLDELEL